MGAIFGGGIGAFLAFDASVDAIVSLRVEIPEASDIVSYDGYFIIETERRFGELLADALRQGRVEKELERQSNISILRVERITHGDFRLRMKGEGALQEDAYTNIERIIHDSFLSAAKPPANAALVVTVYPLPAQEQHSIIRTALTGAAIAFVVILFIVLLRLSFRANLEP